MGIICFNSATQFISESFKTNVFKMTSDRGGTSLNTEVISDHTIISLLVPYMCCTEKYNIE